MNSPIINLLNLNPENDNNIAAFYNETRGTYSIGNIEFFAETPFTGCIRLKPVLDSPEGYTSWMGDGIKAVLLRGGSIIGSNITVLTRAETWAANEEMSR